MQLYQTDYQYYLGFPHNESWLLDSRHQFGKLLVTFQLRKLPFLSILGKLNAFHNFRKVSQILHLTKGSSTKLDLRDFRTIDERIRETALLYNPDYNTVDRQISVAEVIGNY